MGKLSLVVQAAPKKNRVRPNEIKFIFNKVDRGKHQKVNKETYNKTTWVARVTYAATYVSWRNSIIGWLKSFIQMATQGPFKFYVIKRVDGWDVCLSGWAK